MKNKEFARLYTADGEGLSGQPWDVYPRPQMARDSFLNLNGDWAFGVDASPLPPEELPLTIRVPFAPESILSGVEQVFAEDLYRYYKTTFTLPDGFLKERVLLHFGAVDQETTVWVNGQELTTHSGGYAPFSVDITDVLQPENTLVVRVADHLSEYVFPYGKQSAKRGGMWYTPVSGIWQTVWLESVAEEHIVHLRWDTDAVGATLTVEPALDGEVAVQTPGGEMTVTLTKGTATITPDTPRLWSPEAPFLYRVTIRTACDEVSSYFALRTLEIKEVNGISRLCLNGKPYFFHGLLDQGYWSDGLFLPATPKGYEDDILAMKGLGFNTLRKHIKVEPEQFYYDCDRLGMIVFQDMVNNGDYSFLRDTALPTIGLKRRNDRRLHRDPETRRRFEEGMAETVTRLYNHPCICYWTIFNEGWGQFESGRLYRRLKELDDTRFIDAASGWFVGGDSDVDSPHVYFKPFKMKQSDKPVLLSEFGGYSYKPEGHVFNREDTYGYRFFKEQAAYEDALLTLYREEIIPAIAQGLCGAIYTQVSDVEDETNGLLSYDRRVVKVSAEKMQALATALSAAINDME